MLLQTLYVCEVGEFVGGGHAGRISALLEGYYGKPANFALLLVCSGGICSYKHFAETLFSVPPGRVRCVSDKTSLANFLELGAIHFTRFVVDVASAELKKEVSSYLRALPTRSQVEVIVDDLEESQDYPFADVVRLPNLYPGDNLQVAQNAQVGLDVIPRSFAARSAFLQSSITERQVLISMGLSVLGVEAATKLHRALETAGHPLIWFVDKNRLAGCDWETKEGIFYPGPFFYHHAARSSVILVSPGRTMWNILREGRVEGVVVVPLSRQHCAYLRSLPDLFAEKQLVETLKRLSFKINIAQDLENFSVFTVTDRIYDFI